MELDSHTSTIWDIERKSSEECHQICENARLREQMTNFAEVFKTLAENIGERFEDGSLTIHDVSVIVRRLADTGDISIEKTESAKEIDHYQFFSKAATNVGQSRTQKITPPCKCDGRKTQQNDSVSSSPIMAVYENGHFKSAAITKDDSTGSKIVGTPGCVEDTEGVREGVSRQGDNRSGRKTLLAARASEGQYKCNDCGLSFSKKSHLNRHIRIYPVMQPSECKDCGKACNQTGYIMVHQKVDPQEIRGVKRQHECTECGKLFSQKSNLNTHLRTHRNERPYACHVCGKTFNYNSTLKVHLRTHTDEKPYPCRDCDKRFNQQTHLAVHRRVHSDERPYKCNDCGKTFRQYGSFKMHGRIHSKERPYPCKECGKRFAQSSTLKIHTRTHTNERPYVCRECGKAFINSSNLKVHVRSHARIHHCTGCGEEFPDGSRLEEHLKMCDHPGNKMIDVNASSYEDFEKTTEAVCQRFEEDDLSKNDIVFVVKSLLANGHIFGTVDGL